MLDFSHADGRVVGECSEPVWKEAALQPAGSGASRAEEVKAYEEYVKTDEYIKDVAEEKLGLVDPNEIIFKPAE